MTELPFQLQYALSRRQRLAVLLRMSGPIYTFATLALEFLLMECALTSAFKLELAGAAGFVGLAAGLALLNGQLIGGLIDVLFVRQRRMDLLIEENGLGFLLGRERWWLFLDGLTRIEQLVPGLWTLVHWNGTVIHIPADVLRDDQLAYFRAAMQRGQTPEGVRAVIERGRRLTELYRVR